MRRLKVPSQDPPITSDTLFILQLRLANESLLPKLKTFECYANEAFIPFIPLFLSCETISINIRFAKDPPTLIVASVIIRLPILCPDLESITLNDIPEDLAITEAISEMLLACNRDILRCFYVDSPLTEQARNVLLQLPKLSSLWVVLQGRALLPPVVLPNLCTIDVEFGDHLDWLQGFRGMTLGKLENTYFSSHSRQIGDFLGEFKNVALTTSTPTTLQEFHFRTSVSWNPSYHSLLPFTQLKDLLIEFSCGDGCSSRVDDDIIIDLARAMPKLQLLRLGGTPCRTGGGITAKGLIALAYGCRHLSKLRIHFETASLVEATTGAGVPASSDGKTMDRWQDCALTDLEVGWIPIHQEDVLKITMTLLQIFPHLVNVKYTERKWKEVAGIVELVRRIGNFVRHTGKTYLHALNPPQ